MDNKVFGDAVLLFDKPKGKTSYRAIEEVQRLLGIKKIGHSGTLDKSASGLLVICTGLATKLTRYFLESDKRYIGTIRLGITTDTDDEEGAVIATGEVRDFERMPVQEIVERFTGEIEQMPPLYSALKINGRRASDKMRKGEDVSLKARRVVIREMNILEINPVYATITVDVLCSKGTYIRSLARDVGEFLGTGAYLKDLRRTESGGFSVTDAADLDEIGMIARGEGISKQFIRNPVDALSHFGRISVREEAAGKVMNGAQFGKDGIISMAPGVEGSFVITDDKKNLIAIADVDVDNWSIRYLNVFNR